MRIGEVGTTTNDESCPTLWATERGTFVVQGTTVTDPEALATMRRHGNGLPDYESAVEVPAELLPFIAPQTLGKLPFANEQRPDFKVYAESVANLRKVLEEIAKRATAGSQ